MKTVIITGGNGTIASAIHDILLNDFFVLSPSKRELDITDEIEVRQFMQSYPPDVLINCAGHIFPQSLVEISTEELKKHFQVNVFGSVYCAKYAILNGGRIIISIGSTSAFEGRNTWGAYSASKAAQRIFIDSWAVEGIECYSVHPARTNTKMREKLFPAEDKKLLMSPNRIADVVYDLLMGKIVTPSGSHLIVRQNKITIVPPQECPK